jgi:hypothetical protein
MNYEERRAIRERCDSIMADFDARHPEIALMIAYREAGRPRVPGAVNPSNEGGNGKQ